MPLLESRSPFGPPRGDSFLGTQNKARPCPPSTIMSGPACIIASPLGLRSVDAVIRASNRSERCFDGRRSGSGGSIYHGDLRPQFSSQAFPVSASSHRKSTSFARSARFSATAALSAMAPMKPRERPTSGSTRRTGPLPIWAATRLSPPGNRTKANFSRGSRKKIPTCECRPPAWSLSPRKRSP